MNERIEDLTVGELARYSGVSVRTLHHYDAIGLLKPARVADNGYRYYGWAEALRLQEIMFYREVGLSLKEIADLLAEPTDAVARLMQHRDRLTRQMTGMAGMLRTLDATIAHLEGKKNMTIEDLYKPFDAEKQAGYEDWLIEQHGPDMADRIATSKAAIANMDGGLDGAMARLKDIESRLVAFFDAGIEPTSDALGETLEDQRTLMSSFWGRECGADGLDGLAETYLAHPDFITRYETLGKGFTAWLTTAMKAHASRLRRGG